MKNKLQLRRRALAVTLAVGLAFGGAAVVAADHDAEPEVAGRQLQISRVMGGTWS